MSSCCPVGSEPARAANYTPLGKEIDVDGVPCYVIGTGTAGILLNADVYGWKGGRTRLICDQLADAGFNVILPDYYRGNDCVTANADVGSDGFVPWVQKYPYAGVKADAEKAIKYLKDHGATKVGSFGHCWGCWVNFRLSGDGLVDACVNIHPAFIIETIFGGKVEEIASKVKCDQLICPAGNDPADVKEDGATIRVVKDAGNDVKVKTFETEVHGFHSRGDLSNDKTAAAVKEAMGMALEFLKAKVQ
eukprot:Clim_evm34s2 gene=Clim_evmTU34s2